MDLRRRAVLAAAPAALLALPGAAQADAAAAPLPMVSPAAAGFSSEGLQRLDRHLAEITGEGGYLGAVALLARGGRIAHWQAHGHRDLARRQPMTRDTIFRLYSMSKPIASVAALLLLEQGRLTLDDPVARYLPDFAALAVAEQGAAPRPPRRPLALRHLLTHTGGFALGPGAPAEAARRLAEADPPAARTLAEYAERVARAPLGCDPGTRFAYDGVHTELLGRIVELVAGQPFEAFVQQRILAPLRMVDTAFSVPPAQRARIAELTTMGADGRLQRDSSPSAQAPGTPLRPYPSGAGGLYGTAADYARFAQLLANGGELDGLRLLSRHTVALMMRNHLAALDPPTMPDTPGEGFGLGGAVLLDPAVRGRLGSVGQFGWTGSATTWFTVDRQEQLVALLLMQHLPRSDRADLPRPYASFQNLVYQALA